jgi:hypothetical protein
MMPFEESPLLDNYKDGLPELPQDPPPHKNRARTVLLAVFIVVLLLLTANFLQSPIAGQILGTGAVMGRVLNPNGEPFHGEVLILGTDQSVQTAEDGSFLIERIPSGQQSLIILDETVGIEIRIDVKPAVKLDTGKITFTGGAARNY